MSEQSSPVSRSEHPNKVKTFFGHPFGLTTIFFTEMWELFSYFSMRAILLYLLVDTVANNVLGLEQSLGESLVQVYSASIFLIAVLGGWVSDRLWGPRRSTLYGAIIIALGHACLSLPMQTSAYVGIILVAIGSGVLKPNTATMVGQLYDETDPKRDAGYSLFYMSVNIGSFVAPFAVSAVRSFGGYHAGFSLAAIGMVLALVCFVVGRRYLPAEADTVPTPVRDEEKSRITMICAAGLVAVVVLFLIVHMVTGNSFLVNVIDTLTIISLVAPIVYFIVMFRSKQVTADERSRLRAFIPLFIAAMMFFMIFEQASSSMASFQKNNTDLNTGLFNMSPELFAAVNPIFIVLLTPFFARFWETRGRNISTAVKFTVGLALAGLSFIWLGAFAFHYLNMKAPWWVITICYIIQTIGELCLSPVGLAATTLLAPKAFRSQALSLWFLASAAGQSIGAQVLKATGELPAHQMFLVVGGIAVVLAVVLAALSPWISRHIHAGQKLAPAE